MAEPMQVEVVSADRVVWSGASTNVIAKTTDGEIGVLTGHQPTLAVLIEGEVRVGTGGIGSGGDALTATIDGGFLSVENDTVLVVAERVTIAGAGAGASGGRSSGRSAA